MLFQISTGHAILENVDIVGLRDRFPQLVTTVCCITYVIVDSGPQLLTKAFEKYCHDFKVKYVAMDVRHPQTI